MSVSGKCQHIKEDGTSCGAFVMRGSTFCYFHNPEISDEEKRRIRIDGGLNRSASVGAPLPRMKIKKPQDAVLLLADTIHRVRAGEMDVRVANCIGVLSGQLIKAFEVAQLGEQVERLERAASEKAGASGRAKGWT